VGLRPALKADLSLLGISAIWGATFVVVKRALDDASPFAFLACRFLLATAALGWIFRRDVFPFSARTARDGSILGLFLCLGFGFQTIGLLHTTPSRSAFLTGLYVVAVPLMAAALRMRGLTAGSLAGVALALAGLYFLTEGGGERRGAPPAGFGVGEILTILCAVAFAAHIIGVDIFSRRHDVRSLAFWQVAAGGALCVPLAWGAETPRLALTASLAGAIAVTSLGGTALAFAVQNAVQSKTTPTRAAIILASEPVFAAVMSYVVEGERMTPGTMLGAFLILAGMLASEIPAVRSPRASS